MKNRLAAKIPVIAIILSLALGACGSPAEVGTPMANSTDTAAAPTTPGTETAAPTETPAIGIGSIFTRAADGMKMLYVPQGEFTMGSDGGAADHRPAHKVVLDAFWLDQTEVTNSMYQLCVQAGACKAPVAKSSFKRHTYYGDPQFDSYPVMAVNWDNARAYCEWAGARLPTEGEWEKAARGTDERTYPWGETPACSLANTNGCQGDTSAAAKYEQGRSPFGLYDMAGNVWEWTADWYDAKYYASAAASNPQGPESGQSRVVRGGSWYDLAKSATTTSREKHAPGDSLNHLGFRCALAGPAGQASFTGPGATPMPTTAGAVTAAPGTPEAAGTLPPACEHADISYGQTVQKPIGGGGEFIGGRSDEFSFCGYKDDVVDVGVTTALLPWDKQQTNKCLHHSFFGTDRLRILASTGSDPLAESTNLGLTAFLAGFKLPYSGLFRIFMSYAGNGLPCYRVTVTLEKQ